MNNDLLKALIFAGSAALASNAYAINWGATVGFTTASVEEEDDAPGFEGDIDYLSIGATLDTSTPAGLFGYRGTLAYISGEYDIDGAGDLDYDGFTVDNSFAFRVSGNESQRYWVGPAIDLQVVDLDSESNYDAAIGVGIGASVGIDFYQPTGQFFGIEAGFRVGGITLDFDDNVNDDRNDVDLDSSGLFVRGSFFFSGGSKR